MSDEDTKEDKGANPGVLLKGVNKAETKYRDNVRNNGDDDNPHGDTHGIVRHRAEDLPHNDVIYHRKPSSNDDIEDGAEFGAPPAERVPGGCNRTETELSDRQPKQTEGSNNVVRTFGPRVPV